MNVLRESFSNQASSTVDSVNEHGTIILKTLLSSIRIKLMKMRENFKSVSLIVGNINDLVITGVSISQLFIFINCLQDLLSQIDGLSLVISTHFTDDESESLLGAFLRHSSDLTVTVAGLKTGLSKDVSGILSVFRQAALPSIYHYRLMDRHVKIFTPGASAV